MRAVEPRDSGHLKIRGFTIFYEDFGDSAAPPDAASPHLAHRTQPSLEDAVPFLARSRRVVTFDPPGIGGGERTTDTRAFEDDRVVDYAVGLLDHLDIERPDVLGFSLGGAFGLWLAARLPGARQKLIPHRASTARAGGSSASFWEVRDSYERLAQTQRELLAHEFRRLAGFLLQRQPVNAPLDQARRRSGLLGKGDDPGNSREDACDDPDICLITYSAPKCLLGSGARY